MGRQPNPKIEISNKNLFSLFFFLFCFCFTFIFSSFFFFFSFLLFLFSSFYLFSFIFFFYFFLFPILFYFFFCSFYAHFFFFVSFVILLCSQQNSLRRNRMLQQPFVLLAAEASSFLIHSFFLTQSVMSHVVPHNHCAELMWLMGHRAAPLVTKYVPCHSYLGKHRISLGVASIQRIHLCPHT